jgi:hypothetical protein
MANPLVAQAGKLDRRVTIIRAGTPTRTAGEETPGTPVETALVLGQAGARHERFQSAENAATALWRFIFRWRPTWCG